MVNLSGLFDKARRAVRDNPDAVRGGLDKVEGVLNERTKGKYADKLQKGREGLDKALGVPGQARDGYRDESGAPERTEPVTTDPIAKPEPVDRPSPIDDLTAQDAPTPRGDAAAGGAR